MTEQHLVLKKLSWKKGEVPEHLKKYIGQISEAPTRCKGKKGAEYRECLIIESRKIIEEREAAHKSETPLPSASSSGAS